MNDAQAAQLEYARYVIGFCCAIHSFRWELARWMHIEACLAFVRWAIETPEIKDDDDVCLFCKETYAEHRTDETIVARMPCLGLKRGFVKRTGVFDKVVIEGKIVV